MTHTPTPWRRGQDGNQRIYGPDGMGEDSGLVCSAVRARDIDHIVKCVNAQDDLIAALKTWLEEYIALVNSGDAGFWDPEKELKVIKTRELLLQVQS